MLVVIGNAIGWKIKTSMQQGKMSYWGFFSQPTTADPVQNNISIWGCGRRIILSYKLKHWESEWLEKELKSFWHIKRRTWAAGKTACVSARLSFQFRADVKSARSRSKGFCDYADALCPSKEMNSRQTVYLWSKGEKFTLHFLAEERE